MKANSAFDKFISQFPAKGAIAGVFTRLRLLYEAVAAVNECDDLESVDWQPLISAFYNSLAAAPDRCYCSQATKKSGKHLDPVVWIHRHHREYNRMVAGVLFEAFSGIKEVVLFQLQEAVAKELALGKESKVFLPGYAELIFNGFLQLDEQDRAWC